VTVHFVHVGKTGGSAIRAALKKNGFAYIKDEKAEKVAPTPYGRIQIHRRHGMRVPDVPDGDHVFFCLRDPISRFFSGFYSRLRKGQPRYYVEWRPAERQTFETFTTPSALAHGLVSDDETTRERADAAMEAIRHLRPMWRWVGTPDEVRARDEQILYVGRQETLNADWEQLKRILELPAGLELPTDPALSHKRDRSGDEPLDDAAKEILRDWYSRDYELLEFCDQLRAERGWGAAQAA